MNAQENESKQVKQTFDLCKVIDKQNTGKVALANFLRIAQLCGLKTNPEMIQKYTQQQKN